MATTPIGDEWSTHRLCDAAEIALQLEAPASATTSLQRALAEPPTAAERWPLLWLLGRAELLTADPAAAQRLQEAFDECGDPTQRPFLAGELADALARIGRASDAYRVLDEVAALGQENRELALHLEARLLGLGS